MTILSRKIFPQKGRKLELVENEMQYILIQCLVFNKTIIPLTLVEYRLRTSSAIWKLISNARSWNLMQLGRERRWRRQLKFELPVFPFVVCINHSFLYDFALSRVNIKNRNFNFEAAWRLKWFILCCSRSLKTTKVRFSVSVNKGRRRKGGWLVAFPRGVIVFCN